MQHDHNPLSADESSAVEGDGDRGRYSLMVRCASQSSLDECSQRVEPGPGARAAHALRLLESLERLRADTALCDVRLRACAEGCLDAGGGEGGEGAAGEGVPAHRSVLAASSPYFRAMFTQFDERTRPAVTIQNVEPEALQAIIDYIYNPDSLVITEENVQAVLSAASLLQVTGARAVCCAFLASALAPDNALGIRAFAELHACSELQAAAARFLDQHFLQVLDADEFLALAPDALAALIDSDRITVPNEEVILDAVIRWMQHDPEARRIQLGTLLQHVRLPLLARDTLVARAAAEPLCSAPVQVKDLVIEALSFHLMRPERRAVAAAGCPRARPRRPPRAPRALLVVGGQAPKAGCGSIPFGVPAMADSCAAAVAPLPRGTRGAGWKGARCWRVQWHPARPQRGRIRRGSGRVVPRAAAVRAPLHAGRGRHRPRRVRRGRVRRHRRAQLRGGPGPGSRRVAARGQHELQALVGRRGRAGRPPVRRGGVRRGGQAVLAVSGEVRPGARRVGAGGGHVGAALGRGRGRGARRAVRGGRPRRARRAPLRGAPAARARRRLGARRAHDARAPQRRRRRHRRQALRRGRGRRSRQPGQRRGVRPGGGLVDAAGGADGAGPLVRRRVRRRARLTRAPALPRGPPRAHYGENIYEPVNCEGPWWWRVRSGRAQTLEFNRAHEQPHQPGVFNPPLNPPLNPPPIGPLNAPGASNAVNAPGAAGAHRMLVPHHHAHQVGTVPRARALGRVCGVRVSLVGKLSASCGAIADAPLPLPLVLLPRCRRPPPASCSYHLLPESHRPPPTHPQGAACCGEDSADSDSDSAAAPNAPWPPEDEDDSEEQ